MSALLAACRPVVRQCEQGHPVFQGEEECEEGHSVVEREAERDTGVLGQILDVFNPATCLPPTACVPELVPSCLASPRWLPSSSCSWLPSCMGDKLSKLSSKNRAMAAMPDPVVVAASHQHTATVIFLHGLGDSGHGWAPQMSAIKPPGVKVVCPSANKMAVTLNSGFQMPSWFDLKSLDPSGPEDEAGVKAAAAYVNTLIEAEVAAGIPSERIVVGGFSQGGALALYTALTTPHRLAGVVGLSCWMPLHRSLAALSPAAVVNRDIPFLQAHGDMDPTVPCLWGQMTAQLLGQILTKHEFKVYKGLMHSSNDDELKDVKQFLEKRLQ